MADDGDKTEQPTQKKLDDARKKGQLPRSKEAGTFFVLMAGVLSIWGFSSFLGKGMMQVMHNSFNLTREQVFSQDEFRRIFIQNLTEIGLPLLGIVICIFICAFVGSIFIGGFNFSQEALMPKFSKLDPIKGIGKIFSINSIVELIKGIFKIIFIGSFCYFALSGKIGAILSLSYSDPHVAIKSAIVMLFHFMVLIVCALIPIVMLDVPYQKWHYVKQLRMSKQEIKDEYKDTEGNPQIKGKIKQLQFQMAARRMMEKVPQADVVVTNPTHYAVALSYDQNGSTAPIVVAKGVDEIAERTQPYAVFIYDALDVGPRWHALHLDDACGAENPYVRDVLKRRERRESVLQFAFDPADLRLVVGRREKVERSASCRAGDGIRHVRRAVHECRRRA